MKALGILLCAIPCVVFALDAPVVGIWMETNGDSVNIGLFWNPVDGATQYNVYTRPGFSGTPVFLEQTPYWNHDFTIPAVPDEQDQPAVPGLYFVTAEQVWISGMDFSDQQGFNGWQYGYTDSGSEFQLMTEYDDGIWYANSASYWTRITGSSMHPNGTNPSEGLLPVLQQCVLRWVSPITGTVQCSGHVAKDGIGGNGVEWLVKHNDLLEYGHFLVGEDSVGFDYDLEFDVLVGDTIDFILDPHEAEDYFDSTSYGVTIRSQ